MQIYSEWLIPQEFLPKVMTISMWWRCFFSPISSSKSPACIGTCDLKPKTDFSQSLIKQELLKVSYKVKFPCTGLWNVHILASWVECRKLMWGKVKQWQQSQFYISTLGKGWVYSYCFLPVLLCLHHSSDFPEASETTNCQASSIPSSFQGGTTTVTALMRTLNGFKPGICPMGKIQSSCSKEIYIRLENTQSIKITLSCRRNTSREEDICFCLPMLDSKR